MTEPITTIGLGAIAAYLGKDGLEKLLGPTAGYLGDGLRDFTKKRVENIGKIFQSAQEKLGDKVETPGEVPPRVLKTVINEGSYATEAVAVEYFGGVLASSRTEAGRDDRGARVATLLDGLSTYQLRTHYLLYGSIKQVFSGKEHCFGLSKNRAAMQIFLPYSSYSLAMEFSQHEANQPQLLSHVFHGLFADGLIENTWQFGNQESLKTLFAGVPEAGIVCQPSVLGTELFLWAFGHGDKPLEYLFDAQFEPRIEGIPSFVAGSLSTKTGKT